MEKVLVHTKQNGVDGRAIFDIIEGQAHGPEALIYRVGTHAHSAPLDPAKLRKVKWKPYAWVYDEFVYLRTNDEPRTVVFGDGFYRLGAFVQHRGETRFYDVPMQVMGLNVRVVVKWMMQSRKNDWQVDQAIELDLGLLEKAPASTGMDFLYQGPLAFPDSVEIPQPHTLN